MAAKTKLTFEEFAKLEPPDGVTYELDDGELIITGEPSPDEAHLVRWELAKETYVSVGKSKYLHELVKSLAAYLLAAYAHDKAYGRVFVESQFRFGQGIARQPDIGFISAAKLRPVAGPDEVIPFVPDLVIEVISESDSMTDAENKVRAYLSGGVLEVWQVLPEQRSILVRTTDGIRELKDDDVIETPVLPGFHTRVSEFFPQ